METQKSLKNNALIFTRKEITSQDTTYVSFSRRLSETEKVLIVSLIRNSIHPLKRAIIKWVGPVACMNVACFVDLNGIGIYGVVNNKQVKLGSLAFIPVPIGLTTDLWATHVEIDGVYKGYFKLK